MPETILFVDDDTNFLAAMQRQFRKQFVVITASAGEEGIKILRCRHNVAVVISDLMMPEIDGIHFLTLARDVSPDTVRIMLTGHASLERAIEAVNNGYIFQFLTKPCPRVSLAKSIMLAVNQHHLLVSQRELHSLRKMKEAFTQVIGSLSAVVESRDRYTAGHQERVAELATAIAQQLQLSPERTEMVKMASLVHDIGKIYVPLAFLSKPGRLSPAEFSIIQAHTVVGHDILEPLDFQWPISDMVIQHHERMDGSGYPQGLKGDDILLEARIIAVADVVDAITSDRPYRRGKGLDKAIEEITGYQGQKYDPEVVQAFLKVIKANKEYLASAA